MKKFIVTLMMMAMMALMLPSSADAQTRTKDFYRKHRNLINVGVGTGAGALLGGLLGGKRGALIGTAVGAGGSALYTYKINPKTGRRYRVYR